MMLWKTMRSVGLALIITLNLSPKAVADQDSPLLGPLFEVLLNAEPNSPDAFLAQEEIWRVWLNGPNAGANILMNQGIRQIQLGAYAQAIASFTALIQLEPHFAEAWNKRATAHFLAGHYADSLADIDQTIDLEPRHFGAQSGRGLVLDAMEESEAALDAFEKALRINPHMPQIQMRVEQLREELKGRQL